MTSSTRHTDHPRGLFSERFFKKAGKLTVCLVFFVILMGGLVRVTGAGMGCPDWPKCFGRWVPPTDISQLPADYKEIYKKPGHVVADFNVVHTYTEYINRLSGALLGIVMMVTAVSSLQFIRKKRGWITVLSISALLLTGFQGWIGAKVVDSNLAAWMVTIHMVIALLIVVMMMLPVWMPVIREHAPLALPHARTLRAAAIIFSLLTLFQILLGTQVREKVDETGIATGIDWNQALGGVLVFHRTASLVVTALITWMLFKIGREAGKQSAAYRTTGFVVILVVSQILTGVLNVYMNFPAVAQLLHIFIGTLTFGYGFYLYMQLVHTKHIGVVHSPATVQ